MEIANTTVYNNHMMMTNKKRKKTSQGRKKIEIKKIEQENSRQVTFSKRRTGLFNKASELCVLTGAEIAVVAQSPGGKFFTFGHPNVDLLIDRYLNCDSEQKKASPPVSETSNKYHQFSREYTEICKESEAEKKKMSQINRCESSSSITGRKLWWEEFDLFDDRVGLEEVEEYMGALQELKRKVLCRADDLMLINSSSSSTILNLVQDDQMVIMNQIPKIHVAGLDEHELMMLNSSSPTNLLQDEMEKHVVTEQLMMNPLQHHEMMNQTENYVVGMNGCNIEDYDLSMKFDFSDGMLPAVGSNSSFLSTNFNLVQEEMSMNQTANVHVGMEEQLIMSVSSTNDLLLQDGMMNQTENYVGMDDCNFENYDENTKFDFSDGMVPAVESDFEEDIFGLSSTFFWEGVAEELCFI